MDAALTELIEDHLEATGKWVSAKSLTSTFGVKERDLRAVGDRPGLCSAFAISGNQGFKHIKHATEDEFEMFYERLSQHSLNEFTRASKLRSEWRKAHGKPDRARRRLKFA